MREMHQLQGIQEVPAISDLHVLCASKIEWGGGDRKFLNAKHIGLNKKVKVDTTLTLS